MQSVQNHKLPTTLHPLHNALCEDLLCTPKKVITFTNFCVLSILSLHGKDLNISRNKHCLLSTECLAHTEAQMDDLFSLWRISNIARWFCRSQNVAKLMILWTGWPYLKFCWLFGRSSLICFHTRMCWWRLKWEYQDCVHGFNNKLFSVRAQKQHHGTAKKNFVATPKQKTEFKIIWRLRRNGGW